MKNTALLLIAAITTLTTGCSLYSRKECQQMNWYAQGEKIAMKGQTSQQGEAHYTKACDDVPMDLAKFNSGYAKGLKKFCTPQSIKRFGEAGGRYKDTCATTDTTPDFISQYQTGRESFLVKRVAVLESQVSRLESDLSDAKNTSSDLASKVRSLESDVSSCQR